MPDDVRTQPFDKAKIEAYLRHVELWLPQVTVAIDDPKPSSSLAGFNEVVVHLTYNGGTADQTYLVSGKRVSLRLWRNEKPQKKPATRRDYETVGYVLSGQAELVVEGQTVMLEPGDSWLMPAGAEHAYRILTEFTAVEATSPPAQVHGRDEP